MISDDREDEIKAEGRERELELSGHYDLANGSVLVITPKSHVFEFRLHEGSANGRTIASLEIPQISMQRIWMGLAVQIDKARTPKL
jgi:hypothetical protein